MKKYIAIVVAIFMIALFLIACGSESSVNVEGKHSSSPVCEEAIVDVNKTKDKTSAYFNDLVGVTNSVETEDNIFSSLQNPETETTKVPEGQINDMPNNVVPPTSSSVEPIEESQPVIKEAIHQIEKEPTSIKETTPPPHSHSYKETVIQPTCTSGGYTLMTCSCGDTKRNDTEAPLDHSYGEWVVEIKPTQAMEGRRVKVCDRCGNTVEEAIEKLPSCISHDFAVSGITIEDIYPLRNWGYTEYKCSICGTKGDTVASYIKADNPDIYGQANAIVSYVNTMRASAGLSQLWTSSDWTSWANNRAKQLASSYSHSGWTRSDGVYMTIGENIASGQNSGADFYYAFLNSSQHCGIMKDPDAVGIGVGIYVDEEGNTYCAMVLLGTFN